MQETQKRPWLLRSFERLLLDQNKGKWPLVHVSEVGGLSDVMGSVVLFGALFLLLVVKQYQAYRLILSLVVLVALVDIGVAKFKYFRGGKFSFPGIFKKHLLYYLEGVSVDEWVKVLKQADVSVQADQDVGLTLSPAKYDGLDVHVKWIPLRSGRGLPRSYWPGIIIHLAADSDRARANALIERLAGALRQAKAKYGEQGDPMTPTY